MRVLVTGASGLLGTWLLRAVPPGSQAIAVTHRRDLDWPDRLHADLRVFRQTADALATVRPAVVVHAAYARDSASIVDVTRNITAAANQVGARVMVVSTDAVFSGDGRPRAETDEPDPVWDYGRWKAEAERIATRASSTPVIVRLPLLASLDPLDATAKRVEAAAASGESVGWYAGERRQPAHAAEVAEAIWQIVQAPAEAASGVWHLPGPERLTRRAFGARIASALGVADPGVEVPAPPARSRPRDLHLTAARARAELGWDPTPVLIQARGEEAASDSG